MRPGVLEMVSKAALNMTDYEFFQEGKFLLEIFFLPWKGLSYLFIN